MTEPPIIRLLVSAVAAAVDEMHHRLTDLGFPGLRPAHGFVLNMLDDGTRTTAQLSQELGMSKQGAAKLVSGMADLGLVELVEHPHDARARPVRITARGRKALEAAAEVQRRMEGELARAFGRGEVEVARRVLSGAVARWAPEGTALRPLR